MLALLVRRIPRRLTRIYTVNSSLHVPVLGVSLVTACNSKLLDSGKKYT